MFDKIEEDEITKKPTFGDRRCVGYYASIVDALDYITSIHESTYKYCIIEAINEGAIPVIENSWKYITNNECLKSIRENVDYFIKIIKEYQKENITNSNFFNDLQEFSQTMIDEIINKFKNENSKRFDDISEYVHKLKLNLNQEFKKLNEENIALLKEKYTLDLDKEINSLFQNEEKLLKENHINFISNLLQIKYKLDTSIPDFSLKDQISYDKIIKVISSYK